MNNICLLMKLHGENEDLVHYAVSVPMILLIA